MILNTGNMAKSRSEIISVIIPVYNESFGINRVISRVRDISNNEKIEIIIVDGNPSGNTLNSIEDRAVISLQSEKGRARQMNIGAESADGDILIFLHADTMLPDSAFTEVRRVLSGNKFTAGAFRLKIDSERLPFRFIEFSAMVRNSFTRIPYGDQAIFIRRETFFNLGKFSDIPLMEDFELMKRIKKSGKLIYLSGLNVITSARKWETDGIFYTSIRNWILQLLYAFGTPAEKLAKYYYRESPDKYV